MTLRSLAEVCNFDFFTPSKLRRHAFFGLEQTHLREFRLKVPDTAKAPFRDEGRGNTGPDAVPAVQGLRCPDACVTAVVHRTHLGGWRVGLIVSLPLLGICLASWT